MKLKIVRPDGTTVEIEGTDAEIAKVVPALLPPAFTAFNVPYAIPLNVPNVDSAPVLDPNVVPHWPITTPTYRAPHHHGFEIICGGIMPKPHV